MGVFPGILNVVVAWGYCDAFKGILSAKCTICISKCKLADDFPFMFPRLSKGGGFSSLNLSKTFFMKHLWLLAVLTFVGCSTLNPTYSPEQIKAESIRINLFFDRAYQEWISPYPEIQTALGIHKHDDKLDGWNGDPTKLYVSILTRHLEELKTL